MAAPMSLCRSCVRYFYKPFFPVRHLRTSCLAMRTSPKSNSGGAEEKETHFGYETVLESEKTEKGMCLFVAHKRMPHSTKLPTTATIRRG